MMREQKPPPEGRGARPIDQGIARAVRLLQEGGIETIESCEGGDTHPRRDPTVWFAGEHYEGLRAVAVAQQNGLKVARLCRVWDVLDLELVGPQWEIEFVRTDALREDPKHDQLAKWRGGKLRA
jgi:hypothetical protein